MDERTKQVFGILRVRKVGAGKWLTDLRQTRFANKYHVTGTDHAIAVGTGLLGLITFRASQPCVPLCPCPRRSHVLADALPPAMRSELRGRTQRNCLALPDGSTRLVVMWSQRRPRLFEVIDQGSIGWPARFGIYHASRGALRGS